MNDDEQSPNTAEIYSTMTRQNVKGSKPVGPFSRTISPFSSDYLISIAIKNAQRGQINESFPSSAFASFNISHSVPLLNSGALSTG